MTKNDAHTEGQAENLIVSKTIQTVLTNADGNPVGMNLNPQCWVRPLFQSSPSVVVFWGSGTAFAFILPALPCSFYPFPHCSLLSLTCSSAGGHPLCLRCLTMEIWRPKLRWTEQHSSQIRTPRLILVQPGSGRQKEINGWCCITNLINTLPTLLPCPDFSQGQVRHLLPLSPLFSAANLQYEVFYEICGYVYTEWQI